MKNNLTPAFQIGKILYFKFLSVALLIVSGITTNAQTYQSEYKQTVRGTIIDDDSKTPLYGASVSLINGTQYNTITDADGNFRFENIPIGRISVQISYIGYVTKTIPDIVINSGKEVVLDLSLQESVVKLDEIIVKAQKNKGQATNDMALLSSRSISVEETKRFTNSFNDPAKVVTSYAGVASSAKGGNDMIVRGNSPKYMQWRLEGTEITSPYHFDDQNVASGGLSAINNNLLATSDFYTGAFAPEYGNVLSSVYDIKFRSGNNEKYESSIGVNLMGTDITLEGPIKKGYAGSYLFNYRYSTVSILDDLNVIEVPGLAKFQDAAFKINLPSKKAGTLSFFGLWGKSSIYIEDITPQEWSTPTNNTLDKNINEEFVKGNYLFNAGMNYLYLINDRSYIKTTLSYSFNGLKDDYTDMEKTDIYTSSGEFLDDSIISQYPVFKNRLSRSVYRGSIAYSIKPCSKNKFEIGTKYTLFNYDYYQSLYNSEIKDLSTVFDFNKNMGIWQNYISWRFRPNNNITVVTGLHNMNAMLIHKSTFEPRLAIHIKINNKNSLNAGYGLHSTIESLPNYYARIEQPDGSFIEPNKNLDFLKAHHFVVGYERRFTENLRLNIDLYYQDLYNLPVENVDTSYYATINEGVDFKYVALVNKGTGKNYGVELTLERFFNKNYFYLISGSLYNSTYKALEGVERNTRYNNNYILNVVAGKEFVKLGDKKNKTLGINVKFFMMGAQPYIPLLRNNQGQIAVDPENNKFWDYSKAYDHRLDNLYSLSFSFSLKINRAKTTHEFMLDMQNFTNKTSRLSEYYDANEPGSIGYVRQMFFFPNIMYKIYF